MPMIGQPTIATHSISRATLRPNISPTEPWNTVWSWLNTPTGRPLMVPWPVTTPSPNSALGSPGVLAQRTDLQEAARVDQRVDARAGAGDALLVALGDGLLTTGFLCQLQLFAKFGQQFRSGFGGHFACFSSASMRLIASLMCAPTLAMYGSSIAWMCSPPIGTTSSSDDELTPAAVRLAGGVARLEEDRVVVVAVGHVERDVAVVGLDLRGVDDAVVQIRRALVLDDAAGDLHAALLDGVEDELHLTLVVELLELLVRDRGDLRR